MIGLLKHSAILAIVLVTVTANWIKTKNFTEFEKGVDYSSENETLRLVGFFLYYRLRAHCPFFPLSTHSGVMAAHCLFNASRITYTDNPYKINDTLQLQWRRPYHSNFKKPQEIVYIRFHPQYMGGEENDLVWFSTNLSSEYKFSDNWAYIKLLEDDDFSYGKVMEDGCSEVVFHDSRIDIKVQDEFAPEVFWQFSRPVSVQHGNCPHFSKYDPDTDEDNKREGFLCTTTNMSTQYPPRDMSRSTFLLCDFGNGRRLTAVSIKIITGDPRRPMVHFNEETPATGYTLYTLLTRQHKNWMLINSPDGKNDGLFERSAASTVKVSLCIWLLFLLWALL